MPPRRLRYRFSTPPPVTLTDEQKNESFQLQTPQRSAILSILYYYEKKGIPYNYKDLNEVFGFSTTTCGTIVKSNRARRIAHSDEPDTRGTLRELTNSDANAIATYINEAEFDEKAES
jgi:arginine utilization protein RocB